MILQRPKTHTLNLFQGLVQLQWILKQVRDMLIFMTPEEIQKLLIYRDAMMLVLNKPGGVPVHKGFGGGETVDDWVEDLRFGLLRKPALAHRLDKDTSGCLILGRHAEALRRLSHMFANNQVKKTYWAIVIGKPVKKNGRIDLPLVKKEAGAHRWHMKAGAGGQEAITDYKVMGVAGDLCWLELKPQTGRTHQLRVHCAEIGCPILGDKIYGGGDDASLHLHAQSVEVPLYPKKAALHIEAVPPTHIAAIIASI